MKKLFILFLMTFAVSGFAQQGRYEIPVDQNDYQPPQDTWSHMEYRVKHIRLSTGQPCAVLYKHIWGYSSGSTFEGACSFQNRQNIRACIQEDTPLARACYNAAIKMFNINRQLAPISRIAPQVMPSGNSSQSTTTR